MASFLAAVGFNGERPMLRKLFVLLLAYIEGLFLL